MELGLANKTVIITGGGSNIGRAIVHAFADEGSNIVIAELDPAQGQRVADEVAAKDTGSRAMVVATDVTNHESVNAMVEAARCRVRRRGCAGEQRGLDHRPAISGEAAGGVGARGAGQPVGRHQLHPRVLPGMVERQGGSIVCLSSDAGRMGEYREAVYSACKAGVIALSKSIARETGRYGLRLNCVCPGLVVPPEEETISETSMWHQMRSVFTPEARERAVRAYPLRRMAEAREIANAVVFLASDAAGFITGQTLSVSGGYTMA